MRGPGDSEEAEAAVERIYAALADARGEAERHARAAACASSSARATCAAASIRSRPPERRPPAARRAALPRAAELFLRSGYRDEVKYAMALMSGFRRPEDADLFRVVGRHEEFTLYAAVALAPVSDDPLGEWLALLPHVDGWGRTSSRS